MMERACDSGAFRSGNGCPRVTKRGRHADPARLTEEAKALDQREEEGGDPQ